MSDIILHQTVKETIAAHIAENADIADYCVECFGRGALVVVDWFGAEGAPGENEAPYIFLFSTGENADGVAAEDSFDLYIECGGIYDTFKAPRKDLKRERTNAQNGMVVNGCAASLEILREMVLQVVKNIPNLQMSIGSIAKFESSTVNYPLEWSACRVNLYAPREITL